MRKTSWAGRNGLALAAGPLFAADATLTHHLRVPFDPPRHAFESLPDVLVDTC
ncbi:hypothetical protein [Streptomyces caniferus]|uniref:hypothetical protein n=1 Tax=Streptomyces caniferus TaxID=285557 RepID=UPI0037F5E4A5